MLYMFSGPDFLYATNLFPNASTYVLAGLEPAGDIPQLTNLSHPAVAETLHNLENSLGTILSYSFFITNKMKTQLHEGPVYGTMPVLYVFMARTGKTIHEVNLVGLDTDGNFMKIDDRPLGGDAQKGGGRSIARSAAPGVKIVFSDGAGPKQTLYYFSTNLSDGSIERSGFLAFFEKLAPADSFIKSASYLLHRGASARCAACCSMTARRSSRTTAAFRWRISTRRSGGCSRSAATSGRSAFSAVLISPEWLNCSEELRRSSLASVIAGERTNQTCFWRRRGAADQRPGINAMLHHPLKTKRKRRRRPKRPATAHDRLIGLSLWGRFPVLF